MAEEVLERQKHNRPKDTTCSKKRAKKNKENKSPDSRRAGFLSLEDLSDEDAEGYLSTFSDQIRRQVEYYLSDDNLRRDNFYRSKIVSGTDGWFCMSFIMSANRIKTIRCTIDEVAKALQSSDQVETKHQEDGTWLIRRACNAKLPAPQTKRPHYRRRRYGSEYGFGDGMCGFSGSDCDDLLTYGVKPWDDDAGSVFGYMGGFY